MQMDLESAIWGNSLGEAWLLKKQSLCLLQRLSVGYSESPNTFNFLSTFPACFVGSMVDYMEQNTSILTLSMTIRGILVKSAGWWTSFDIMSEL